MGVVDVFFFLMTKSLIMSYGPWSNPSEFHFPPTATGHHREFFTPPQPSYYTEPRRPLSLTLDLCDDVVKHVNRCRVCQRKLNYNPYKNYKKQELTQQLLDLGAFLSIGILVIIALYILINVKCRYR